MNYTTTSLPKSELEIEVTLPFSEFEPHIKRAAVLLSEENEIEGFRRGKAPYDIVKNRFGEAAILDRAAELAVKKTYPEVLTRIKNQASRIKNDFTPIGSPNITVTKLAPGNELQYKVKVALLPEVKLPDYKKIAEKILYKETQAVEVTDEEIAKTLDWIRESRTKLVTVNRPARSGDRVEVSFETRHGGAKVESGDSHNHPVIIGKGKFLPGFEDQLLGMKAGEEKDFTLTVPDAWHKKNLAGKALDFHVKMILVQERIVPELNDEFAKSLGNFSSLESLRQSIRDGILAEKEEKEKQRIRALIIEEVAEKAEAEIPDVLIEREVDKMLDEMKSGVESIGMKWEDYLLHLNLSEVSEVSAPNSDATPPKPEEVLRAGWREQAEKRVRIALCLYEIAKIEKIEPTAEEIEARANQYLAQFKTVEEAERSIDPESLREYIKGVLRNEKVFELLES